MWSSAAVAHLVHGWTRCAFRNDVLHSLVVTSVFLSYCRLSTISNQSAPFPLTSHINRPLSTKQPLLTEHFVLFKPFPVNHKDVCENPSRPRVSDIFRQARLGATTMLCSKSLKSPLFPHSDAQFEP